MAHAAIRHLEALASLAQQPDPDFAEVLEGYRALEQIAAALGAAVVQQAREGEASWNEVGTALLISQDTARKRWTAQHIDRLLEPHRVTGTEPASQSAPRSRTTALNSGPVQGRPTPRSQARRPAGGRPGATPHPRRDGDSHTADCAQAPPGPDRPDDQSLTTALSDLQRCSGRTMKAIAHDAGIDPSYITRILAGERIPSWQVTRGIASACHADPQPLRPLWEAARGVLPGQRTAAIALEAAAALHDVLCDLHLAAARPAPSVICEMAKGRIRTRDVAGLLDNGRIPDWHTVDQVVTVLHGRPDDLHPLWRQARQLNTSECRLPAMAFG